MTDESTSERAKEEGPSMTRRNKYTTKTKEGFDGRHITLTVLVREAAQTIKG